MRGVDTIELAEKFYSIQGEALSIGKPAFFIRFSGCNLRCQFCDAKHSWVKGKEYVINDIVKDIKRYPTNLVVLTGGEPLLHQDKIVKLARKLPRHVFEIETNGTLVPFPNLSANENIRYNVSPKLSSSGNPLSTRIQKMVLENLKRQDSIFKFVVKTEQDWREMEELVKDLELPKGKIYVMPEGMTDKETKKSALKFIEKIKEKGYNLSPRLQVWLKKIVKD